MAKATKKQIKRERSQTKTREVIKKKGYHTGKLPFGKVLHHVKAVSNKGKTTAHNTRVISETKHKKIHADRRKRGEV